MKKMKSYRLSDQALKSLAELRSWYPEWTDTEILEKAIDTLNAIEYMQRDECGTPIALRMMNGERYTIL